MVVSEPDVMPNARDELVSPHTDSLMPSIARPLDRPVLWLTNLLLYLRHARVMLQFRARAGYWPDAARPSHAGEKMLWRKLFDHDPRFVVFTDKLATRALRAGLCPDLASAELLWCGTDAAAIPEEVRRRPIVIKASHGCGHSLSLPEGRARPLRRRQARQLNGWLRQTYGRHQAEWAYRHAGRRLFAEAFIETAPGEALLDLSVHAVDGLPLFVEAILGNKTAEQRKGYFHPDGRRWPEIEPRRRDPARRPALPADFRLPGCLAEALRHAARLAAGADYLRVDFLVARGRLHGGEIAVYPGSGLARRSEFEAYDALLASRWDLSRTWFLATPQRGWRRFYAAAFGRHLAAADAGP
jgi:hypothetical protein